MTTTSRTFADRVFAAIPAALAAVSLLVLYGVQAWARKTPWVFSDEMEWTQLSRAIAATGHAARRGHPIYFKSLYSFVIAPAWWIHSTATAYAVVKYINAVVMLLAAIPTYLLARMLLLSRRWSFAVAVLAVLIPCMSYSSKTTPLAFSSRTSAATSSTDQNAVLAFDVPAPADGYMKTHEPLPHS